MRRVRAVRTALALLLGAVALVACGTDESPDASQQPQGAALRVTLGTQDFPEARVLGELWRQALAVNGYAVDLQKGIGPAEDLDQALQAGDIDGYVAYTGTVLSVVAGEEVTGLDPEETYDRAEDFYATQDMVMSEPTPFENRDALATTTDFAQQNGLESIADLAAVTELTDTLQLGARPEFEDLTLGLQGLRDVYGLTDLAFRAVPLGEQYAALDDGQVQVVDAFTTDPQLASGRYQLLDDPERLFGSQNVVMVVGQSKLDRIDADAFLEVVDTVNGELTEEAVVAMNAEVTEGRDEQDVARDFLRAVDLDRPLGRD